MEEKKCQVCQQPVTKIPLSLGTGLIRKVEWKETDICYKCSKRIVPSPMKDENGKLIWKNLFKMQFISIVLIISVLAMTISYKLDTAKCQEAIENPIKFCEESITIDGVSLKDRKSMKYDFDNNLNVSKFQFNIS